MLQIARGDYSRDTWVYRMRQKSDGTEVFKHFPGEFGADGEISTMMIIRSDGVVHSAGSKLETCADHEGPSKNSRPPTVLNLMEQKSARSI